MPLRRRRSRQELGPGRETFKRRRNCQAAIVAKQTLTPTVWTRLDWSDMLLEPSADAGYGRGGGAWDRGGD